jgi:hypothetical protein
MDKRHDALIETPDTIRDVLVCDECGYFAVAWYHTKGEWIASTDLLEAENYDGGATIRLTDSIRWWWELPTE